MQNIRDSGPLLKARAAAFCAKKGCSDAGERRAGGYAPYILQAIERNAR